LNYSGKELARCSYLADALITDLSSIVMKYLNCDEISYKFITTLKNQWMIPYNASNIDMMEFEEVNEIAYFNGPI
jgi:hypothetical protein